MMRMRLLTIMPYDLVGAGAASGALPRWESLSGGGARSSLTPGYSLRRLRRKDGGEFFAAPRLVQRVAQFHEHMLGGNELAAWHTRFDDGCRVPRITAVKQGEEMEGVRENRPHGSFHGVTLRIVRVVEGIVARPATRLGELQHPSKKNLRALLTVANRLRKLPFPPHTVIFDEIFCRCLVLVAIRNQDVEFIYGRIPGHGEVGRVGICRRRVVVAV